MTLAEVGEDALVARLLRGAPGGEGLVVPSGDDCAAVEVGGRDLLLLKTDCVVEGIHYLPVECPKLVGRKALARALSDVAAMGGRPLHALVAIFSPPDAEVAYWEGVYAGLYEMAQQAGVAVVGGESSESRIRAVTVALTGRVSRENLWTRSGGRVGDILMVTGRLGGSLKSGRHLTFSPRLAEGQWLASRGAVHAMMDLSDGLARDLPRLARACGTGWELDAESVPTQPGCDVKQALTDGEDYELLVSVEPRQARRLAKDWYRRFPDLPLTMIGRLTGGPAGEGRGMEVGGYEHFRPSGGGGSEGGDAKAGG